MIHIKNKLDKKLENLKFHELTHEYNLKGKPLISVTQLVKGYQPEFDPTGTITARCAVKNNITPREQADIWEKQAQIATDNGTRIHKIAEEIMNNSEIIHIAKGTVEEPLMKIREQIKNNILATEQRIFNEDLLLAGTVDLLLSDGEVIDIYDYKTNKKPIVPHIYYEKMLSPIDELPANDYYKYALQLSLYRYILELDGFKVRNLCLIHLTEQPEIITLPYLNEVIKKLVGEKEKWVGTNQTQNKDRRTDNKHLDKTMQMLRRTDKDNDGKEQRCMHGLFEENTVTLPQNTKRDDKT